MNAAKTLDDLSTQAIDIVTEAHRSGIEVGLRRMVAGSILIMYPEDVYRQIAKLDVEFNYTCPCVRFKDDLCERCGKLDLFATEKA